MHPHPRAATLFLTRSWHGRGGMQRLSRDLARCLTALHSGCRTAHPAGSSRLAQMLFLPRAALLAMVASRRGIAVHLGDAALTPIAFLCPRGTVSATACGLDVIYPSRWYQALVAPALRRLRRVHCISGAARDAVVARGVRPDRTVVVPCGVWFEDLPPPGQPPSGTPALLTVGRLIPRKGVAWFVAEVLPRLRRELPTVVYHVVGDGPQRNLIKKIVQEEGLQRAVVLHGDIEDTERDRLLVSVRVFVAPNVPVPGDMEGFGIVCIEAAARGVPVVAAALEGLTDAVVPGATGELFPPRDAEACAAAILRMVRAAPDSAAIAAAARSRFAWTALLPRVADAVLV